jgi:hypothetical protein
MSEVNNVIEVPITSEGVLGLRNACITLKEAFRREIAKQIVDDENAIVALTAEQLKGVKAELVASKDMVDGYYKMTADDQREPTNSEITSYGQLKDIKGNLPVTDQLKQETKSELNSYIKEGGRTKLGNATVKTANAVFDELNPFPEFEQGVRQGVQRANVEYGIEGTNVLQNEAPPGPQFNTLNEYFKDYEGMSLGDILKECVPCDFRKFNLDQINPMVDLLATLEQDLVGRYRQILAQFSDLLSNNEINEDICSLLNYLNFQCVPDLFGIISLLKMMMLKLTDLKLINPTGLFLGLLTPFFSPILNGITEILDKYIQLILGPIDCIIDSLDSQLAKLDVDRALDRGRRAELTRVIRQRNALDRRRASLTDRLNYLVQINDKNEYVNDPSSYQVRNLKGTRSELNVNLGSYNLSRSEEIEKINSELLEIGGVEGGKIAELNREIETLRANQPRPNLIGAVGSSVTESRQKLRGYRNSIGKSLEELRVQLTRGKNMINDTADSYRKELTRLILGRAETSEEMLQGAMELQRLARMIGIARTLIRLANGGTLCDNGNNPDVALGNFLTAKNSDNGNGGDGTGGNGGNPVFYRGRDDAGEEVLVVTTSDAELELVDENDNESAVVRRNGEEAARLNSRGVAPDLGNIAQKKITATSASLGVEVPVSVVPFNLCGETSAATSETIDNIKSWAGNLG